MKGPKAIILGNDGRLAIDLVTTGDIFPSLQPDWDSNSQGVCLLTSFTRLCRGVFG